MRERTVKDNRDLQEQDYKGEHVLPRSYCEFDFDIY